MNEQTVQDMVLGRLQGDALGDAERHISECSSCAELVALAAVQSGAPDSVPAPALAHPSRPSIAVGTVVGRFVILEFVGAGGMGEVYAAYDPNLERKVAIKFLRPELVERRSEVATERLRREARLVAKLSHPNVVVVYEIDVFEDRLFIAMEYVDGQSVSAWLRADARPTVEVLRVFRSAGAGLSAAHAAGVIHRDFKPHNVMLTKGGDVRVMDFGLAHLDTEVDPPASGAPPADLPAVVSVTVSGSNPEPQDRLTRTGALLGTPAYMAPEQLLGEKASARSDQYSFCVALFEALFGRRPSGVGAAHTRTTAALETTEVAAPTRPVPAWIRRILKRGLAPDPGQRYPSMEDLLADLRADKTRRRKVALAAIAGLVLVSGATWGVLHGRAVRRAGICRSYAATAAAVWPFESASQDSVPPGPPTAVRAAFLGSGAPNATDTFARVSRTLSTYLKQWAGQATDTCAATHVRAEQSREVMALRMACLHERLSTARALTETLTRADAKVVSHALDAALGLPDLDRCSELVLLRAAVKPPEGAARQAEVERLRRRMADVKLMTRTGHFEAVASEIEKLERDIRAADYPPLLVDFLLFVGSDVGNLGVPTKTASSAREALMVAEGAGYEEGIAEALTAITVTEYRNAAFADLAYDQADAILRHLGDPLVLRAWLENNASLTAYARGRIGKALGHATRALALKERRTPRDARDIAIGESNICWLLDLRGQPRDALPHCDRAVQLINEELGSTHPQAVNLAENRASVLTRLGRFAEGCSVATYVRAFFEGRGERIDQRTTLLLTLGRCAVNDGDPAAGVRHVERALAEANRSGATPAEIGEIEWQLGSIVDAAGDHRRGVDVADRALKRYASLPEFAERQHQIRAWLAARRTRDR